MIVIDRFHFVRYGVWLFENVRKRVQKSLNPQQRKLFKRSRKLLLARASRLTTEDRQAVEVMLAHSEDLMRAWLLKEEFFKFVDAQSSAEAKTALDSFRYYAISTDDVIKALKAQVEQQQTRINELEQQSGKQQLTISNHEYFLKQKGLTAEFEAPAHAQEHTHHHHP